MTISRRTFLASSGLALVSVAEVSGRVAGRGDSRSADPELAADAAAAHAHIGAGVPARGHAQRLEPAVAHERRLEGVPSGGRAGGARDRARHEGAPVGLQRPVAGSDHRVRRGRQGAHLRHQQAARAHHHPLARHASALRHGRRRRADAAAHQARQDLRLRVGGEEERHLHVPPARRRDGADGDGHDGLLRRASAGTRSSCPSTATSCSCSPLTPSSPAATCRRSTR